MILVYIYIYCIYFCHTDGLSLVEPQPQYWTLTPEHHVIPNNNNNGHVTSLTNHGSAYGGNLSERSTSIGQTFPANFIVDEVFANGWNDLTTLPSPPSSRQPINTFQPTKCLPPARQLPATFDDVISARQRTEYYGNSGDGVCSSAGCISWCEVPRQPCCQYEENSISGSAASSFGTRQTTCNSTASLAVCPASTPTWLELPGQQAPAFRRCAEYAEYRMSRYHVVSDVTSSQCGWTDVSNVDDMMWRGKFINPLEPSSYVQRSAL